MRISTIACVYLFPAAALAQVYKCPTPEGVTAYSQTPCERGLGSKLEIKTDSGNAVSPAVKAALDRCKGKLSKNLAVGMPKQDAICAASAAFVMGNYKVNRTVTAGRVTEQYVGKGWGEKSMYLYFTNDVLTAFQD
jgi:hypothetical protein